jgi:hypothetical protein
MYSIVIKYYTADEKMQVCVLSERLIFFGMDGLWKTQVCKKAYIQQKP